MLYEDLRIEIYGIDIGSLTELDRIGEEYRRQYFLRRSTITLVEFTEALTALNRCPEFEPIRNSFATAEQRLWQRTITSLNRYKPALVSFRNDLGGHFGDRPAQFAVNNFTRSNVGVIDWTPGVRMLLRFVGHIVAPGYTRSGIIPAKSDEAKLRHLFKRFRTSYIRCGRAVNLITSAPKTKTQDCTCAPKTKTQE